MRLMCLGKLGLVFKRPICKASKLSELELLGHHFQVLEPLAHLEMRHEEEGVLQGRRIWLPTLTPKSKRLAVSTVLAKPQTARQDAAHCNRLCAYLLQGACANDLLRNPIIEHLREIGGSSKGGYANDIS
eukprot:2043190-Amphidinium_carterae.1